MRHPQFCSNGEKQTYFRKVSGTSDVGAWLAVGGACDLGVMSWSRMLGAETTPRRRRERGGKRLTSLGTRTWCCLLGLEELSPREPGAPGSDGRAAWAAGAGAHRTVVCLQVGGRGPPVSGAGRRFLVSRHHSGGVHAARLLHEDAAGVPGTRLSSPRAAAWSRS